MSEVYHCSRIELNRHDEQQAWQDYFDYLEMKDEEHRRSKRGKRGGRSVTLGSG